MGVQDRGDEVAEGLAGARAGLDQQVLLLLDGVENGLGHLGLAGTLDTTQFRDCGLEEFGERGHVSRIGGWVPGSRAVG
ncbi:hypothetical protein GCM10009810_17230 [Nostocoides vanveenii]|uniref:Transposase n=1 Tax=Nostocoides vanveenii TaxID=330835 RepID=A0ABN2KJY7_9MICO